jgi:hypothetical protein
MPILSGQVVIFEGKVAEADMLLSNQRRKPGLFER